MTRFASPPHSPPPVFFPSWRVTLVSPVMLSPGCSVVPTAQWMEAQLPDIILSCLGTSAPSSFGRAPSASTLEDADVDKEALALTHYNAVAGSCLLIGEPWSPAHAHW